MTDMTTNQPQSGELKACPNPWCRDNTPRLNQRGGHLYYVMCAGCGIKCEYENTETEAITAWNTRPALSPAGGDLVTITRQAFDFLMGTEELEGEHFGDSHADYRGRFWWRSVISAKHVIQSLPPVAAPSDDGMIWREPAPYAAPPMTSTGITRRFSIPPVVAHETPSGVTQDGLSSVGDHQSPIAELQRLGQEFDAAEQFAENAKCSPAPIHRAPTSVDPALEGRPPFLAESAKKSPSDERTVEVVARAIATLLGLNPDATAKGDQSGEPIWMAWRNVARAAIQAHLSCLPGQVDDAVITKFTLCPGEEPEPECLLVDDAEATLNETADPLKAGGGSEVPLKVDDEVRVVIEKVIQSESNALYWAFERGENIPADCIERIAANLLERLAARGVGHG